MELTDFCKTDIRFMSMNALKDTLLDIQAKKIVLVMSSSACIRFEWQDEILRLRERYELLWIDENTGYPTQEILCAGLKKMKSFDPDAIIAVGGGSAIDFAKGLKALFFGECNTSAITQALRSKEYRINNDVLLLVVPTTAGTGSEVTQWATVWDSGKKCKYSLDHPLLKPNMAFIVPEFTLYSNRDLTIITALDCLSHAIEAYWSKKSNPLVRTLSKQALLLIIEFLPKILEEPENLIFREKQCLASVLSGLSFSMTRTTASHSISYPLTMDYAIPHGIAVVMTLAQVAKQNSGHYEEEEELVQIFSPFDGIKEFLAHICKENISLRLRDYGVIQSQLKGIAEKSFTLGRMDNNPAEMTLTDVENILKEIF